MTLAELVTYVRDLTGVYSTDLLSDALIKRWLQESYSDMNRDEDWSWMVSSFSGTMPAGSKYVAIPSSSGRVKEVAIVQPNGNLEGIVSRRSLIQTQADDDGQFYDHEIVGNETRLTFTLSYENDVVVNATYMAAGPILATSGKASLIPEEFEGLLAYKTAIRVLFSQGDDGQRAAFYDKTFYELYEALRTEVVVDEDLGPFQIGGEILRQDGRTVGRNSTRYRSI